MLFAETIVCSQFKVQGRPLEVATVLSPEKWALRRAGWGSAQLPPHLASSCPKGMRLDPSQPQNPQHPPVVATQVAVDSIFFH